MPGADLGLWNRPPDHVWTMEWRGLRLRSQRIAEMHPVSPNEPTKWPWGWRASDARARKFATNAT